METTMKVPFKAADWKPKSLVVNQEDTPVRVLCVDGPNVKFPVVAIQPSGKVIETTGDWLFILKPARIYKKPKKNQWRTNEWPASEWMK